VEVLDGPQAGTTASTNAKGEFVLRATVDASTRFGVTKDGYVTGITTARPCDGCLLHVWFDFVIQLLAQTVDLAGNYTLTFIADSTCTAIPSELRTRTYAATIAPADEPFYPAGTFFVATMPGVPHWTDRNRIPIATAGDFVWFILGEDGSPYFVEEVAPGAYIHFDGGLRFSVGGTQVSTISTSLNGWADYWGPAVTNPVHCVSANHRMILTRQ
jgi:hypothetical protein